jgi:hypothetical protein
MPATAPKVNMNALISRITRDQGPEFEQTLAFANTTQVSTPTSLRTDRKIRFFDFHFRGRLTNAAAPPTYRVGPPLLGTPLFSLVQQFTLRGQHLRYGAQTPIIVRGESAAEFMALMNPNWVPRFAVSVNGAALVQGAALSNAANATNDVDWVLPIPMFPYDLSPSDQTFYSLHGPDWPGNLYFDVNTADATALGSTLAQQAAGSPSAFGSAAGSPSLDILSERPLVSKDLASKVRPGVTFRVQNINQPTVAVSTGAATAGVKIADLTVGKDTTRIFVKVGTSLAATSAGVVVYGTLSDTIITRTVIAMDNRQLRFQNANANSVMQDYMGRMYGRTIPAGYIMLDFISGIGTGTGNAKAAFQSSQLTAARKFEVDGDINVVGATQIAEVVQEMVLGRPALLQAGAAATTA